METELWPKRGAVEGLDGRGAAAGTLRETDVHVWIKDVRLEACPTGHSYIIRDIIAFLGGSFVSGAKEAKLASFKE